MEKGYGETSLDAIKKEYDSIGKGNRLFIIDPSIPLLKLKVGDNCVRILPPLREGDYFGELIFMHQNVGIRDDAFLCMRETPFVTGGRCLICDEYYKLKKAGAPYEELKTYIPQMKMLYNVGNVERPEDGVKVWLAPKTVKEEIARCCHDRETKKLENISNPEKGYDLYITREGEGLKTKYRGIQRASRTTPIREISWLDDMYDLRKILIFPDEEEIKKALFGAIEDFEPTIRHEPNKETGEVKSIERHVRQIEDAPWEEEEEKKRESIRETLRKRRAGIE